MRGRFFKKATAISLAAVMLLPGQLKVSAGVDFKLEPLNPKFVEYLNGKESKSRSNDGFSTGYIPSPIEFKRDYSALRKRISLPEDYTSTAEGLVTSVKNQGGYGGCWSFGATAVLESSIMAHNGTSVGALAVETNYSESNMLYNLAKGKSSDNPYEFDLEEGGTNFMATAYLASGRGTVRERDDDAYNDTMPQRPYSVTKSKPQHDYVREAIFIPAPDRNDEASLENHRDLVKQYVMAYGTIATAFYVDKGYFSDDFKSYYCDDKNAIVNHEVAIVGWNDNYPKENFKMTPNGNTPQNNGAFIIKNSWGTEFHDNGYFYMSYEDVYAGGDAWVVTDVDHTADKYKFDNIYQDDYFGMTTSSEGGADREIYLAKKFSLRTSMEKLTDIGLYTDSPVDCEVYLAKIDINGNITDIGDKIGQDSFNMPGYHTIALDNQETLFKSVNNGKFGVIVKMISKNQDEKIKLPMEVNIPGFNSKAVAKLDSNFISIDGNEWIDINKLQARQESIGGINLCIKAFTEVLHEPSSGGIGVGSSSSNPTNKLSLTVRYVNSDKQYVISQVIDNLDKGAKISASDLKIPEGYELHDKNFSYVVNDSNTVDVVIDKVTTKVIEKSTLKSVSLPDIFKTQPFINGYADKTFKPDKNLTRAEVASMICNIMNGQATNSSAFADINKHWAKNAIAFVNEKGIMRGDGSGNFRPNAMITRAELAQVMFNIMKSYATAELQLGDTKFDFTDISNNPMREAIEQLASNNMINTSGTFRPNESITRAEAVTMMNKVFGRKVESVSNSNFTDVTNHWAYQYIMNAAK